VTDGATFLFSHEDLTYTQVSAGYRHTVLASEVTAVLMPADGMISDIPPLDEGIRYTQVCALWIG